jgi:hypothetical protein
MYNTKGRKGYILHVPKLNKTDINRPKLVTKKLVIWAKGSILVYTNARLICADILLCGRIECAVSIAFRIFKVIFIKEIDNIIIRGSSLQVSIIITKLAMHLKVVAIMKRGKKSERIEISLIMK